MELTLTATTGRELGSRTSGRLRNEGKVPGVVYGLGRDAVAVTVEWTELRRVLTTDAGLNALIDLEVDGETELIEGPRHRRPRVGHRALLLG